MANFHYKAKNNYEIVSGDINAFDAESAAEKLERKGLIVLEISEKLSKDVYEYEKNNFAFDTILALKEKKEFFNAFYFQYKSGLSVREIFNAMAVSSRSKNIQALCLRILHDIESGRTLEDALEPYSNVLGKAYTTLICAGEKSGKLDEVLASIIANISKEEELKKNIISAVTYPVCITCLAGAIFVFFRTFVFKVFERMAGGITQEEVFTLLFLSLIKLVIVFLIIGAVVFFVFTNKKTRRKAIGFISSIPFVSKLMREYYFQNFFMVLALAFEAGVPAIDAVALANSIVKVKSINRKIQKSVQMISNGCEVTTAFMVANVFSKFAISQTSAGEKAGELDKMFKTVAYDYQKKLETALSVMTKLMEPVILIFVGIMVVYILYTGYTKYYEGLFAMF